MASSDIKSKLIEEINSSSNQDLLEELYRFFNLDNATEKSVYELSDTQKQAITEAREEINNGNYLTNDQANQDIDEWLNE